MDSSQQQIWAAVLSSAGLFTFLGIVASGIIKHVNGTAGRERIRNTGLKQQRDEAWELVREERDRAEEADARADLEAHNRRLIMEYASELRRDCTAHGVEDKALRPWPTLKKPPPSRK